MGEILNLDEYRRKAAARRGFTLWEKRFGTRFDHHTTLADIDPPIIYFLALPGEKCTQAYYELIMGALDLGPGVNFYTLEQKCQMRITDIHLFLSDLIRFEMMRRLEWVTRPAFEKFTLIELILQFNALTEKRWGKPPDLSATHPDYPEFSKLIPREKEVFIRQLLPKALEAFSNRLGKK